MNKTIIFISGWQIPKSVAQSKFVWDKTLWRDYRCLWLDSKTPINDWMVEKELDRLAYLLKVFPDATVAGHSLGGWWSANLALRPEILIKKLVLWTPLGDTSTYPIFNVSKRFHPPLQPINPLNRGPQKALVFYAKNDLIVPPDDHSLQLLKQFDAMPYKLKGGHLFQFNHGAGLRYMKDWIELG